MVAIFMMSGKIATLGLLKGIKRVIKGLKNNFRLRRIQKRVALV